MVLGTWFWWLMVLMSMVFACNEVYIRLEILHCNVAGRWVVASSLGPAWPVWSRLIIDLLLVVFPFEGFPRNIGVIAIWFNCLYFILFLSKLHVIFLIWYQSGLTWTLQWEWFDLGQPWCCLLLVCGKARGWHLILQGHRWETGSW